MSNITRARSSCTDGIADIPPANANLVRLADIARDLGVNYHTARSAARFGYIAAWRIGRRWWTTYEGATAYWGMDQTTGLIALPEAARRLGVGNGTLGTAVRNGTLVATRAGGRYFVSVEALETYRQTHHKHGKGTASETGSHEDVSLAEAARFTNQPYNRLHSAVRVEALPATQMGRHVRVQMGDVQAYLEAHRHRNHQRE